MLNSMTGFGAARARVDDEELAVELKSLNHKFCEVKARLPRELANLEAAVVKHVKDRLSRGSVEVFVKRSAVAASVTVPTVDVPLARAYVKAFGELASATGLSSEVSLRELLQQPGVLRLEERGVDVERAGKALFEALDQALAAIVEMRRREGVAMEADLGTRLKLIQKLAAEVAATAPLAVAEYRTRLQDRISELVRAVNVDPQRLAQEVALYAERTDIAEEMTRLTSHLAQFGELVHSKEPAGRKMDFLVQEMHREVNTTGSKSQHPEISSRVVAMKAELERMREQVQNVE
jgi:uncharacterized protein (TIGR00255 family)